MTATDREKFRARVDVTDSCWLWLGSVKDNGYGVVTIDGRTQHAHRVAWELGQQYTCLTQRRDV